MVLRDIISPRKNIAWSLRELKELELFSFFWKIIPNHGKGRGLSPTILTTTLHFLPPRPRLPPLSTPPALPPLHAQCHPCGSMPSRERLAARAVYEEPGSFLPLTSIFCVCYTPLPSQLPCHAPPRFYPSMGIINVSLIVMCTVFNSILTHYFFLSQLLRQRSRPQQPMLPLPVSPQPGGYLI